MEYTEFSKDQQVALVKSRIAGWEAEHYANVLNLSGLNSYDSNDPGVQTFQKNVDILEASINSARQELDRLQES